MRKTVKKIWLRVLDSAIWVGVAILYLLPIIFLPITLLIFFLVHGPSYIVDRIKEAKSKKYKQ